MTEDGAVDLVGVQTPQFLCQQSGESPPGECYSRVSDTGAAQRRGVTLGSLDDDVAVG